MPKRADLERQAIPTPQSLAGLPKDAPVLLALSGGADSRALLHILSLESLQNGFSITLAHVNHGIRGEEALRDRAFCEELARTYGLEICVLNTDVPALAAAHGTGLEEEARSVRYAFFAKLMRERSIPLLVTAHHADDQLETLLFRLCRGTGPRGLGGMAAVRPLEFGQVVRPLLAVPRRDILAYCQAMGLSYVTDSTNADTAYARNRIRAEVIPVMESLFDDPQRRAAAFAADLREDEAYLNALAEAALAEMGYERLPTDRLRRLAKPIARRVLMLWGSRGTNAMLERVHVEELMRLTDNCEPTHEVALPKGICAGLENGCITVLPQKTTEACFSAVVCEGVCEYPEIGFRITVEKNAEDIKINNLSTECGINLYLKSDIMKGELFWRSRREGDLLLRGGMHRRLRRLYREAGVSPRVRRRIPLLCDGEGIVWAPFVGLRDGLSKEGTPYCIKIEQFEVRS